MTEYKCSKLYLDLGSTRIKYIWKRDSQKKGTIKKLKASPLNFYQNFVEGSIDDYLSPVFSILEEVTKKSNRVELFISCQRSSFLIWDKANGSPLTPLISWQDRRAEEYLKKFNTIHLQAKQISGLFQNPHYLAAKLSMIFNTDQEISIGLKEGRYLWGTIDSYLLWKLSESKLYVTDHTMASRTMLYDISSNEWSKKSLKLFLVEGIPLPQIIRWEKGGLFVNERIELINLKADQVSSFNYIKNRHSLEYPFFLVNMGTGSFVLKGISPLEKQNLRRNSLGNYLIGINENESEISYLLEGTINGTNKGLNSFPSQNLPSEEAFQNDGLYCLPDSSGVGAPYWEASQKKMRFNVEELDLEKKKKIFFEGLWFRIYQILTDLGYAGSDPIFFSGGISSKMLEFLERKKGPSNSVESSLLGLMNFNSEKNSGSEIGPLILPKHRLFSPLFKEKFNKWLSHWNRELGFKNNFN